MKSNVRCKTTFSPQGTPLSVKSSTANCHFSKTLDFKSCKCRNNTEFKVAKISSFFETSNVDNHSARNALWPNQNRTVESAEHICAKSRKGQKNFKCRHKQQKRSTSLAERPTTLPQHPFSLFKIQEEKNKLSKLQGHKRVPWRTIAISAKLVSHLAYPYICRPVSDIKSWLQVTTNMRG